MSEGVVVADFDSDSLHPSIRSFHINFQRPFPTVPSSSKTQTQNKHIIFHSFSLLIVMFSSCSVFSLFESWGVLNPVNRFPLALVCCDCSACYHRCSLLWCYRFSFHESNLFEWIWFWKVQAEILLTDTMLWDYNTEPPPLKSFIQLQP